MITKDLKKLTQQELESLLVDLEYEFHDRGWTEEDFIDEVHNRYPDSGYRSHEKHHDVKRTLEKDL